MLILVPAAITDGRLDLAGALSLVDDVRRAARTGLPWHLAGKASKADTIDPAQASTWSSARRVPAALIRHVVLAPDLKPDPRGLTLTGAVITGTLDLEYATCPCPLNLEYCSFEKAPRLEQATLPKLSLRRSHLPGLDLDGAHIDGNIFLTQLKVTGAVTALGAHISGSFYLGDNAVLTNEGGHALNLNGARIGGNTSLGGLHATGAVTASRAHIGGGLYLGGKAVFTNEGGHALDLSDARIDGDTLLGGLHATGAVTASRAHIGGGLYLGGKAVFTNEGGHALDLSDARIGGNTSLDGLGATGAVTASRAHIGGDLYLGDNAVFTNEGGHALNLSDARIDGDILLVSLRATGAVTAFDVQIGGDLYLGDNAVFTNEGGHALNLNGARIDGTVALGNLDATGVVTASRARIGGSLYLGDNAVFTNEGGDALNLNGARIDGDTSLAGLHANGAVTALGAQFSGYFSMLSTRITGPKGDFFSQTSQIGSLFLGEEWKVEGEVNLARAVIGNLVVDPSVSTGRLSADGWRIEALPTGSSRMTAGAMQEVMKTWLSTDDNFAPQPWQEVADVLERQGRPADARAMRVKAAKRTTSQAPWKAKTVGMTYGLLVGYGHRPLRAGGWLVAAIIFAAALTWLSAGSFEPTNPAALQAGIAATATPVPAGQPSPPALDVATVTGKTSCAELARAYPCLDPKRYGLDVVLPPTLSTGQSSAWRPTSFWLALPFQLLRIFAWVLITLLVAGVTGLLRKT